MRTLTDRERQIIALAGQGDKNSVIGQKLGITEATVKNRCTHIYLKLGVVNRVQAVMKVMGREVT